MPHDQIPRSVGRMGQTETRFSISSSSAIPATRSAKLAAGVATMLRIDSSSCQRDTIASHSGASATLHTSAPNLPLEGLAALSRVAAFERVVHHARQGRGGIYQHGSLVHGQAP